MDPTERAPQVGIQLTKVFWCAIGQVMLELGPDELVGIQLGGIGREPMHVQPRVSAQERRDVVAPVNRAAIPEQLDRPAEVPQEVAEKHHDLRPVMFAGWTCMYNPMRVRWGDTDRAEIADSLSRV